MKTPIMYGLVCLLPKDHETRVQQIWQELEEECHIEGIDAAPLPHFSWLIAEDFAWNALSEKLDTLTRTLRPITVTTNGIGIFSRITPVIYIPLVRDAQLAQLHQSIWDTVQPLGTNFSPYYAPKYWVPHITLAYQNITPANINCIMQKLAFQTFNWVFEVGNISFMQQEEFPENKAEHRFNFGG